MELRFGCGSRVSPLSGFPHFPTFRLFDIVNRLHWPFCERAIRVPQTKGFPMVPNQSFFSEVFHSACRIVERDCPDGYAKSYAATGLRLADPEAQRVQMLYLLSNI